MPEKDGDEGKSTKSVVNKKQKQMMGEEGYDIARDMGKVRPSKDKKDATTMPPSKEMRKTQKVNKGPSAFELVKKKYKGQIMNVGKKKANEELDLTQVAEAFGGYIIESESGNNKKNSGRTKGGGARSGGGNQNKNQNIEKEIRGQGRISLTGNIPQKERGVPKGAQDIADKDAEAAKNILTTGLRDEDPKSPTFGQPLLKNPNEDEGVQAQQDAATKQTTAYQQAKAGAKQGIANPTKFTSDTRTPEEYADAQRRRSTGKGDGRRAGRTKEEKRTGKVTYGTFVNKSKVTGGKDRATDVLLTPEPQEIEKMKPKDKVTTGSGKDKKGQKGDTVTYGQPDEVKPKQSRLSKIATAAAANPAAALVAYDLGKGIIGKISKLRAPAVVGGKAGFRSAGGYQAT